MYFVVGGEVAIYINDPKHGENEGDFFIKAEGSIVGEIGLLLKTIRSANVITMDYTILSQLSSKDFTTCVKMDHSLERSIKK